MVTFSVTIENETGEVVTVIRNIPAQTKGEAVNKAKQRLTFSANRMVELLPSDIAEKIVKADTPASTSKRR